MGAQVRELAFGFVGVVDHRRAAQVLRAVEFDHLVDGARDDQVGEDGALAFVKGAPLPARADHAFGADAEHLRAGPVPVGDHVAGVDDEGGHRAAFDDLGEQLPGLQLVGFGAHPVADAITLSEQGRRGFVALSWSGFSQ